MNDRNAYTGGAGNWTPQSLIGLTLADRYRVDGLLGEGGMGSVFAGTHVALRKKVAIKVLHQELCRDPTQVDRFLQEARAASMIGHENIVDIMDFGPVPGGSVFFVMEFLEGQDLADLLRREGRLAWARTRGLMLQIVRALAAAHDKGIIHRDLKPANCFLVRRSDGRDFVKLLDFGIAKVTDPESGDSGRLTRTGAVFGTAKYMAPEQACGEPADQRTDIYAAAICLYEFLTGQVPYDGDNFMRVLSRHLTEPLTLPSTMAPDANISPAVEAIIVKALAKRPDDRYQSMREFEEALLAVAPDGNFAGNYYEGPPQVGHHGSVPNGPGTLWLGPQARPASAPPSGAPQGGSSPPPLYVEDYGSGQLPNSRPPGWRPASGPIPVGSKPPSSPVPANPAFSRGFTHSQGQNYGPTGEHTMFAPEPRSPLKLVLMLGVGGLIAVAGGGLAAWLVLRDDSKTSVEVAEGPPRVITAPPVERDQPNKPTLVIPDPGSETPPSPSDLIESPPVEPATVTPPADPDPPTPVRQETPPSDTGRKTEGRTRTHRTSTSRQTRATPPPRDDLPDVSPSIKDKLTERDVAKGFNLARSAAKACPGGLPGMSIKVRATINQKGRVIDSRPVTNGSLPVAKCVAQAVKGSATFAETTKALDSKEWTFSF